MWNLIGNALGLVRESISRRFKTRHEREHKERTKEIKDALLINIWYAVINTSCIEAASENDKWSGLEWILTGSTTIYSAWTPFSVSPRINLGENYIKT